MKSRIKIAQAALKNEGLDAFLVSHNVNIRYLTGFEGSAGLLVIFPRESFLLVDPRYTIKAQREARGGEGDIELLEVRDYLEVLERLIHKKKAVKLGFEEEHLSCRSFKRFSLLLPGIKLYPYSGFIEKERVVKDRIELGLIKKSLAITEKALRSISHIIRPGLSEKDIADELEGYLRMEGARGSSFRTIVAGPENSYLPHSEPGTWPLPSRGMILVDVGCDYEGYNSDLTRILVWDKINRFSKKIIDLVKESQEKAIEAVRPGRLASQVDLAGRKVIERAGYGRYFNHSLGHGLGLSIHEEPAISKESKAVLKEGMVFTVEPGIYLPGRLGVRLEDIVLVGEKGGIKLSTLPPVLSI